MTSIKQRVLSVRHVNNINNKGNQKVVDMWKLIHAFNKNDRKTAKTIIKKYGLSRSFSKQNAVDTIQEELDGGLMNLTPRQCLELLVSDYRLDVPKHCKNYKATQDEGLTYILQEANCIVSGIDNTKIRDIASAEFNYLDLVDGDYLGTDSPDALYFNKNHKMATLYDLQKEYQNGIKALKEIVKEIDHQKQLFGDLVIN